jgi:uncharacterized membrane protein YidH (DUF202 family)
MSIGLISFGAMSIGALAWGGFGFGIWVFAPFAFGWDAYGQCAIAWNAAWGWTYAVAHSYALSNMAAARYQPHAEAIREHLRTIPFFRIAEKHWRYIGLALWIWAVPLMVSRMIQGRRDARRWKNQSTNTI